MRAPNFDEATGIAIEAFRKTAARQPERQKSNGKRITIRFSSSEIQRLEALSAGTNLSSYVRKCLFGSSASLRKTRSRVPQVSEKALAQILGKLGQFGIAESLNKIAYEAGCGSLLMDETTEQEIKLACARIAWIRAKLIEALGLEVKEE